MEYWQLTYFKFQQKDVGAITASSVEAPRVGIRFGVRVGRFVEMLVTERKNRFGLRRLLQRLVSQPPVSPSVTSVQKFSR